MNTEDLEKFGKVEQFEQMDEMFHVKITDGFSSNFFETQELTRIIIEKTENRFTKVHKFHTDKNLYHLILKP